MAKLRDLLVKVNLDLSCKWRDVRPKIEGHRIFSTLTHLDNIDVLLAFEDHMASLEKKVTINATKKMMEIKRNERKNRKEFKQLLKSLNSKGIIRPYSMWKDIVRDIESDECYQSLLGQPGSTPLDLFRDLVVQLNEEIADECKEIQRTVRTHDLLITPKTTLHDFQFQLAAVRPGFSKDAQKVVFDQLMDSIISRIREDKKKESRKLKKRMDAFKSLLKHLDPPISAKSPWKEVAAKVSHKSEYQDLNEEDRITVFEKIIAKIAGKSNREGDTGDESDEKSHKHRKEKKRHRRRRSGSPNSNRNSSDDEDRHRSSKKKKSSGRHEDDRHTESRHRRRSSRDYKKERGDYGSMDLDQRKNPRGYSEEEEGQVSD